MFTWNIITVYFVDLRVYRRTWLDAKKLPRQVQRGPLWQRLRGSTRVCPPWEMWSRHSHQRTRARTYHSATPSTYVCYTNAWIFEACVYSDAGCTNRAVEHISDTGMGNSHTHTDLINWLSLLNSALSHSSDIDRQAVCGFAYHSRAQTTICKVHVWLAKIALFYYMFITQTLNITFLGMDVFLCLQTNACTTMCSW